MQTLVFTVKTTLFADNDPVQLAVKDGDAWCHLDLEAGTDGRMSRYDVSDEVRAVRVALRAKGPAFAVARVIAKLPSSSVVDAVVLSIPAADAYRFRRKVEELRW